MIFRFVRPSVLTGWIYKNHPSSIIGTAGDNWKKYLTDKGGTGSTFYDLEQSYLARQGLIFGTIVDGWALFMKKARQSGDKLTDILRTYFENLANQESTWTIFFWTRPK